MQFTTTVRVLTDDSPGAPLSGVKVCLYDHDLFSSDDLLGTELTNAEGEARFQFVPGDFVDLDDRVQGVFPDLYVVVYNQSGERVASTRADRIPNSAPKYINVRIARNTAVQHQLLAGSP